MWLDRPVFICGHHRSGTTLLQRLLDGHPELVVLPSEGTYLTSFSDVARPQPSLHAIDRFICEWIARLIDPNQEPHFKLGRSTHGDNPYLRFAKSLIGWEAALRRNGGESPRFVCLFALLTAFKDVAIHESTASMWVEKTPLNECHVRGLAALTNARYLHVVRDPRATLASLVEAERKSGRSEPTPVRHVMSIARSLKAAQRNMRSLADRYLVVRYEDLVANPGGEMKRVCGFLGIADHVALTIPTVCGQPVRSNSSFAPSEAGVIDGSTRSQHLDGSHARLVDALASKAGQRFGYGAPSMSEVARFVMLGRALSRYAVHRFQAKLTSSRRETRSA